MKKLRPWAAGMLTAAVVMVSLLTPREGAAMGPYHWLEPPGGNELGDPDTDPTRAFMTTKLQDLLMAQAFRIQVGPTMIVVRLHSYGR